VEITRINSNWKWQRGNGAQYNPVAESPAIQRTMANLFSDIRETVGREEAYRAQFIRKYGYLYEQGEVANNVPEQFLDELALIAWVTNTLDLITIKNIRPDEISIAEADKIRVATPNPLRYLSPAATVAPTKDIGHGVMMSGEHDVLLMRFVGQHAQREVDANSVVFSAHYSLIISAIASAIDHQLGLHVGIKYESLWNAKRDRNGVVKKEKTEFSFDATHKFVQVAEPRNLIGYAWLCIAEQFNESPDLMYYPCEGFALCDQELPFKRGQRARKDGRPARRMFCSDSCRQRTKREINNIAPWTERWEQHQKTRANVQENLDRLADMESTVLNSQIAGANAIEGIETGNVLLMDDGVNE
jgi:hypothetical protein